MREFQDPMEAELCQWRFCSKLSSSHMEGVIQYIDDVTRPDRFAANEPRRPEKDEEEPRCNKQGAEAIEVRVRGPKDLASSCFYLLEDLVNIVEQTVAEIAPGLPLERHFLSPADLAAHKSQPHSFEPRDVLETQLSRRTLIRSSKFHLSR